MQIDSAHLRYGATAPSAPAPSRSGAAPGVPETPANALLGAGGVDRIELGIPAEPPPDVLEAIAAAAERAHALAQQNRELHFRRDEHSNRIIIEVRDMTGDVIRTIPPSKALDAMTPSQAREMRWLA